jgi:hypothetical protein
VLGADAKVRCWKTRRGGVLGFFAREVFVAGVKEPHGIAKSTLRSADSLPRALAGAPTLEELVAATADEVSFGAGDSVADDHAFRDVLAQAEAALTGADFDDDEWLSEEPVRTATSAPEVLDKDLDDFRTSLESLGLPLAYRPTREDGVLDGLACALASLPVPPALPVSPGSLIAIVGSRRDARAVASEVAASLGLDESDIIVSCDDPTVRRRITRRKRSARVTVVALEAPVRGRAAEGAGAELARMVPDYVLGVVGATQKCSDVDRWRSELGIDALALRRWGDTETPAELLSALPVYSVDGDVMSRLRWLALLLSTYVDRTDATA